jgi:hypothetical protein
VNLVKPQLGVVYKYGDFTMLDPGSQRKYLEFLDSLDDLIKGQRGKIDSKVFGAHSREDFEDKVEDIGRSFDRNRPMAFLFVEPEDTASSANTKSGFKAVSKAVNKQDPGQVKFNSYLRVSDKNNSYVLEDNTELIKSVIGKKGHEVVAQVSKFYNKLSTFSLKGDFKGTAKQLVADLVNALTKKAGLGSVSLDDIVGYEDQMAKRVDVFAPESPAELEEDARRAREEVQEAINQIHEAAAAKNGQEKPGELQNTQTSSQRNAAKQEEKIVNKTINDLRQDRDSYQVWFDEIDWQKAISSSTGNPKQKTILVMMKLLAEGKTYAEIAQEAPKVENSFKKPEKQKKPDKLKARKVGSIESNVKWFRTVPGSLFTEVPGGIEAVKIKHNEKNSGNTSQTRKHAPQEETSS